VFLLANSRICTTTGSHSSEQFKVYLKPYDTSGNVTATAELRREYSSNIPSELKVAQNRMSEKLHFSCQHTCVWEAGTLLSRATFLPYVTQRVYLSPSMAYGRLQITSHDSIFRVATTLPIKPVKACHVPVHPLPPPTHTLSVGPYGVLNG